jgi:hypothetical protein
MAQHMLTDDLVAAEPLRAAIAHYAKGVAAMHAGVFDAAELAYSAAEQGLVIRPKWSVSLAVHQAELRLRRQRPAAAQAVLESVFDNGSVKARTGQDEYAQAFERLGVALARQGQLIAAHAAFENACSARRSRLDTTHPVRVRCESYCALASASLSVTEKQSALSQQMALLKRGGAGPTALAPSLEIGLAWLMALPRGGTDSALQLVDFPMLD